MDIETLPASLRMPVRFALREGGTASPLGHREAVVRFRTRKELLSWAFRSENYCPIYLHPTRPQARISEPQF